MGSPRDARQRAPGHPLPGKEPAGQHLSGLAVALAGAQLAVPPDPGRVARLGWTIFAELEVAANARPGTRGTLPAAISSTRHGGPGYRRAVIRLRVAEALLGPGLRLAGLAAELAAAEASSPPDQDHVAAVAWRILSALGEVTCLRVRSEQSLEAAAAALTAPAGQAEAVIERVPGHQLRSGEIVPVQPGRRRPWKAQSGIILAWNGVPTGWIPHAHAVPQPRARHWIPSLRGA
jgi:hypothetical protein